MDFSAENEDIAYLKKNYSEYFDKTQKLCFKKCGPNLDNPSLTIPEKSCLHRCAMKFKEAEQFGIEIFSFYKAKIQNSQDKL